MQHHFHGVIVLHPRFQGDSSNNHDPKYSLILRVFHCPTPEGKRRDPRLSIPHTASFSGSFIAPLQRGRGEIPDSLFFIQPHSQGLSLPHCRGEGERSQTPYSSYSLILRVFHCPTPEGIGERPQTPYPTYSLIQSETKIEPDLRLHSRGLSLPQPRGKRERPQTPYSSYSLWEAQDSLSQMQPDYPGLSLLSLTFITFINYYLIRHILIKVQLSKFTLNSVNKH